MIAGSILQPLVLWDHRRDGSVSDEGNLKRFGRVVNIMDKSVVKGDQGTPLCEWQQNGTAFTLTYSAPGNGALFRDKTSTLTILDPFSSK